MNINLKTNAVSSTLKTTSDEVSVKLHKKGSELNDIDIIAINEWLYQKDGVELFNALRALALVTNIIEGFDEVFFNIAKELPSKLELENLTTDSIMDSLYGIDKKVVTPFDYIKTLQIVFKETEKSKDFTEKFEENFLLDALSTLEKKFKIITQAEYSELIHGVAKNGKSNNLESLFEYANNISFKRTFLCSKKD